jgi:hypothetical protein
VKIEKSLSIGSICRDANKVYKLFTTSTRKLPCHFMLRSFLSPLRFQLFTHKKVTKIIFDENVTQHLGAEGAATARTREGGTQS